MIDILEDKIVKTRKDHNCWGCAEVISKKTNVKMVCSAEEGEITRTYWCDDCVYILSEIDNYDKEDGFAYGELIQIYNDYYREIKDV